eukprot:554887_1
MSDATQNKFDTSNVIVYFVFITFSCITLWISINYNLVSLNNVITDGDELESHRKCVIWYNYPHHFEILPTFLQLLKEIKIQEIYILLSHDVYYRSEYHLKHNRKVLLNNYKNKYLPSITMKIIKLPWIPKFLKQYNLFDPIKNKIKTLIQPNDILLITTG